MMGASRNTFRLTPSLVRKAERAAHLSWGAVLALYVYGLLPSWGEPLVRWLVIPAIVASGFAMWFAARIRKLLRRARAMRPGSVARAP
jgi:hypothetical protein